MGQGAQRTGIKLVVAQPMLVRHELLICYGSGYYPEEPLTPEVPRIATTRKFIFAGTSR